MEFGRREEVGGGKEGRERGKSGTYINTTRSMRKLLRGSSKITSEKGRISISAGELEEG